MFTIAKEEKTELVLTRFVIDHDEYTFIVDQDERPSNYCGCAHMINDDMCDYFITYDKYYQSNIPENFIIYRIVKNSYGNKFSNTAIAKFDTLQEAFEKMIQIYEVMNEPDDKD